MFSCWRWWMMLRSSEGLMIHVRPTTSHQRAHPFVFCVKLTWSLKSLGEWCESCVDLFFFAPIVFCMSDQLVVFAQQFDQHLCGIPSSLPAWRLSSLTSLLPCAMISSTEVSADWLGHRYGWLTMLADMAVHILQTVHILETIEGQISWPLVVISDSTTPNWLTRSGNPQLIIDYRFNPQSEPIRLTISGNFETRSSNRMEAIEGVNWCNGIHLPQELIKRGKLESMTMWDPAGDKPPAI